MEETSPSPLRVAIVGAGPSGFFAADHLIKGRDDVLVDLIDRLPTPYGLVRYGVAPDHPKIKSVVKAYERTASDPRVRFLGNVELGRDLMVEDLRRHYHATVYAVGASGDRSLGIPGEDLPGSLSATEFVAWYNGHPDYRHLEPDLSHERAVVVGVGNVAVDVARILAKSVDELRGTDIADHALEALAGSRVREVHVLGRRGPAQAKFTTKELREFGELEHADVVVDPAEAIPDAASLASVQGEPGTLKNLEILEAFSRLPRAGKPRSVHLRFLASPVELLGSERLERVRIERNRLEDRGGYLAAVGTGEFEELEAGLLLRSVGYRGRRIEGVPFDARRGVIPTADGRVLDAPGGAPVPGEYATGWIKRGPSGVIGTNKKCALDSVAALLSDRLREIAPSAAAPEAVTRLLDERGVLHVDFEGWRALDAAELAAGAAAGRPRVKATSLEEMLARARG